MIMKMPGKMMMRKRIRGEINIEKRVISPEGKSGDWYRSFHPGKLVKQMPAVLPLVKNKQFLYPMPGSIAKDSPG